jgi:hypothetical protein
MKDYLKIGRLEEDMISPMDSPAFTMENPESPGSAYQTPLNMPSDMDTFSLLGPGKSEPRKPKKKKGSSKSKKDQISSVDFTKVVKFDDFISGSR